MTSRRPLTQNAGVEPTPTLRQRSITDDNRSRLIKLSRAGQSLHDKVIVAALEREERLLSKLTPEEVETLIVCLRKMQAIVPYVNAFDPLEQKKPASGK